MDVYFAGYQEGLKSLLMSCAILSLRLLGYRIQKSIELVDLQRQEVARDGPDHEEGLLGEDPHEQPVYAERECGVEVAVAEGRHIVIWSVSYLVSCWPKIWRPRLT